MAAVPIFGDFHIIVENIPGIQETIRSVFYSERKSYVNGGTTFTFPANFFLYAPIPQVDISLIGRAYDTSSIILPIVTNITTTSATVRVNIVSQTLTVTSIAEAANDDVMVYLTVRGFPVI